MTNLDEIKDILWMHSTHKRHPFQEDEAFANLEEFGDLVIDGLIWGLGQDDIDLKLTVLVLLQEHYANAKHVLPAVRALISEDEDRLVRITAINTANVMSDTSEELIPLLIPKLDSSDDLERLFAAGNLWRLHRSEDAYVVLRRESVGEEHDPAVMMARSYLEETEA